MTGGAQTIVDLLDRFDFAENITSVLIEVEHNPGQKYFIPCMLKNISQNNMQVRRRDICKESSKKLPLFTLCSAQSTSLLVSLSALLLT